MAAFTLQFHIEVFDSRTLLRVARAHAKKTGEGMEVRGAADALHMLLDPGGGGDAYAGNLNEAGFQIEACVVEKAPR